MLARNAISCEPECRRQLRCLFAGILFPVRDIEEGGTGVGGLGRLGVPMGAEKVQLPEGAVVPRWGCRHMVTLCRGENNCNMSSS